MKKKGSICNKEVFKTWHTTTGRLCMLLTFLACSLLTGFNSFAQGNAAARYEIDAKRMGVKPTDDDALPRSREFIRLDSTYYVGWMYEGIYKWDRSADYLGYKNAIPALQKALQLLEKDYGTTMQNLYSSMGYFTQHVNRYEDFFTIFQALSGCYDNLEMPDRVMQLMDKVNRYQFKKDYFGVYGHRAWTYHRNRFLTSANFPFLKNSVQENEQKALACCYDGLAFIESNKAQNDQWFGPYQSENDKLQIYHYLAMLHCYNKNYDSSEYYYMYMASRGAVSWNNFGSMQLETGQFTAAISYYERDLFKSYDRILHEPYYYLPFLHVLGNRTKEAIKMAQEIIQQNGSTPGFGWYNIALARGYLYDGQLDSCEFALNKAANFREIHIGTTLTQNQYNFSVNLLRVQLLDRKMSQIKFFDKGWWYAPNALYKLSAYKIEKMMAEYVVVNELAFNPERTRIVYDLFCSEATTSFDEAWYLLKDFSPAFFRKMYERYLQQDSRTNVQRYFFLFAAKFKWEQGNRQAAKDDFERLAQVNLPDGHNEKLLLGRLYESLALATGKGEGQHYSNYRNALFATYPQLVPFSDVRIKMHLSTSGTDDAVTRAVISGLKNCSVDWSSSGPGIPEARIQFSQKGNRYQATIQVITASGNVLVDNGRLLFRKAEGTGQELALRLFGKGGALEFN
ncbi:hypothetical protein [Filimonas effusa]|uniref:Tetratricopeptide repeat protein n=1 Tax=Filimonas effusa TaxID=2508721 RepID=A0A4Q1DDZ1_9BACT|nr:hypothetical protein [Filimonas effusa]RXK87188.1 hypothetical protein ESB13_10525 [Filimonas effusa]